VADALSSLNDALRDRYLLERELGRGGMATVYLARDLKHERPVALKVLRPELAASLGPERFLREIRLAAQLNHPHILPLFDSGEIRRGDGPPILYYTMPYVEGESLRDRLDRETQLPLEDALQITRHVAAALTYAHERGILHRDIKPGNILLEGGEAVVADFGIGRAITAAGADRLTETGLALGTPTYMSPEQAAGSQDLDGRSDLYALGCVLYEMLAGHPPFLGATAQQVLARHALDPVPSLRTARDAVPEAVERSAMKALAKVPADRFPTVAGFADALVSVPERTAPALPTLEITSRRRVQFAAAVVGLLGLAAAAYVWRPRPTVKVDPDLIAVIPFRVSGGPALGYLREGMIDLVAAKLSGEEGTRAADPRSVMNAWRRTVGSDQEDLPAHAALELARRLGAGQLLLGGLVGSPDHLVLSASLLAVRDGKTLTQANVEGATDSLPLLVDQLIAQLLAGKTRMERTRTGLMHTPLPALRAYLEGEAAHRRGEYGEAVARFDRALELDSTFALAGLGLAAAAGWATAPGAARRGLERAWVGRDRLSPRDRALLIAEVGPRYPEPSTLAEYLAAWEQAVDLAPDQPDRWYELGDVYFHDGPYLRIESSQRQAAEAFRRSVALDSGAAPLGHLLEIALLRGDTGGVRRLGALYLARDSAGDLGDFYRWRIAAGLGDTQALRALRKRSGQMTLPSLWRIMNHAALDGTHLDDADYAAAAIRGKTGSGSEWQRSKLYLRAFELNRGRPHAALADTASADEPEYGPHAALYQRVLDALYGDGDSASGAQAVAEVIRSASRPQVAGPTERATWYSDLCVGELWRLEHGDLGSAGRTITRLRGARAPGDSPQALAINTVCTTILDAMFAAGTDRPDAAAALERLDSVIRTGPGGLRNGPAVAFTLSPGFVKTTVGITPVGFEDFANLIVARLRERQGDLPAALEAVRRRSYAYHRSEYVAAHLREEGRLAALTGDRAGAVRAYQHYLALRSDPEPALSADAEQVRAELAKLLGNRPR
jgi:hypothetical protein